MTRLLAVLAIVLWGITVVVGSILFIKGNGRTGTDGRTVVHLAPMERNFVLSEMRGMLQAVQDITAALSTNDLPTAIQAARSAGGQSVGGVPVSLMTKLPIEFKQTGTAMHASFDEFASAAGRGESVAQLTGRLANLMGGCVGCHQSFRIDPTE